MKFNIVLAYKFQIPIELIVYCFWFWSIETAKMSDDMNMEDVYANAKLAKAREKKLKARQEQDEEKKRKHNERAFGSTEWIS